SGIRPVVSRISRRDPIRVEVEVSSASEHNLWCGLTMEVERGGVFVATHHVLSIGTVVDAYVAIEGREAVKVSGVVRWRRPYMEGSDACPGIGIKFVELSDELRDELARFVTTVR